MKKLFLLLTLATLSISSCSKDDAPAANLATACFEDAFNGTYSGNFVAGSENGTATIKFTKTSCTSATLECADAPSIGNRTISEIVASATGGYVGKISGGTTVSISASGNGISIVADGVFQYTGNK